MKALNQLIDTVTKLVMGVSACVVFVITFAQVLCRYVLKSPLPWSTDILRLAFTYLVFWGGAWCVKQKGHLNVDFFITSLPDTIRGILEIIINMVLCGFFAFLIWHGVKFAGSGLTQTTSYLPIPMTFYYAAIPSAAALMLYYMVQIIAEQIGRLAGKGEKK